MLTFTNPSLLPLLVLLVPLAIHLWNRRPGREVAVGSLRWLTAGANRRLRNLRLEQWPLLLLRLLLLVALIGALAGPAWRPHRAAGGGQILVAPALAGSPALAAERPRLDSLRRRGYGLRWLAAGLPPISRAAWQADSLSAPADSILSKDHLANAPDFYAERLRLAADSLAGQLLYVLTPATLRGNGGTRQATPAGITWRVLPLAAQTTWLQAATGTADSLRLLLGQGNENQVTFSTARVARPRPGARLAVAGLPPLRYQTAPGRQAAQLEFVAPAAEPMVPVRSAALRVWVYAPPTQATEARPLRAALRAAALGLPGPLSLTVAPTGQLLWCDGLGRPVLTAIPLGQGISYQCATRLLPSWSELAASPDLPALLLDVLQPAYSPAGQQRLAAHDPRRLDPGQVQAPTGATARRPAPAFGPPLDLRPWLVLLGLLLFGLERGLAARAAQPAGAASVAAA